MIKSDKNRDMFLFDRHFNHYDSYKNILASKLFSQESFVDRKEKDVRTTMMIRLDCRPIVNEEMMMINHHELRVELSLVLNDVIDSSVIHVLLRKIDPFCL